MSLKFKQNGVMSGLGSREAGTTGAAAVWAAAGAEGGAHEAREKRAGAPPQCRHLPQPRLFLPSPCAFLTRALQRALQPRGAQVQRRLGLAPPPRNPSLLLLLAREQPPRLALPGGTRGLRACVMELGAERSRQEVRGAAAASSFLACLLLLLALPAWL